jgi:hypothetical protein
MNIGTTHPNAAVLEAKAEATTKVNALPNLTDAQRAYVMDICIGHVVNHSGAEPNYQNVAAHARCTVKS